MPTKADNTGILRTQQIAKLLNVSKPTVIKLLETNKIKKCNAPGTKHYRVAAPELLKFLKANNMPVPKELILYIVMYNKNHTS